jgi:plasmid replication initiation protein
MTSQNSQRDAKERSQLQPFTATLQSIRPRDQRDLMERPFFSLAKAKRISPIRYRAGAVEVGWQRSGMRMC